MTMGLKAKIFYVICVYFLNRNVVAGEMDKNTGEDIVWVAARCEVNDVDHFEMLDSQTGCDLSESLTNNCDQETCVQELIQHRNLKKCCTRSQKLNKMIIECEISQSYQQHIYCMINGNSQRPTIETGLPSSSVPSTDSPSFTVSYNKQSPKSTSTLSSQVTTISSAIKSSNHLNSSTTELLTVVVPVAFFGFILLMIVLILIALWCIVYKSRKNTRERQNESQWSFEGNNSDAAEDDNSIKDGAQCGPPPLPDESEKSDASEENDDNERDGLFGDLADPPESSLRRRRGEANTQN